MRNNRSATHYVSEFSAITTIILLLSLVYDSSCDCAISRYPRLTASGSLLAKFDDQFSLPSSLQMYEYPLFNEMSTLESVDTMAAVLGFSLQKKSQQLSYKIESSYQKSTGSKIIFRVQTNTYSGANRWNYILFNFIVSGSSQLVVGSTQILQIGPGSSLNNFKISQYVPTNPSNSNFKVVPKIFISGIQVKQKDSPDGKGIAKIDETISTLQNLKNFGWSDDLINKFVAMLKNQKSPSFQLSTPEYTSTNNLLFEINVNYLQLKSLTVGYVIYFGRRNEENIYHVISGDFKLAHQDKNSFERLQGQDMTLIGLNGFVYDAGKMETISVKIVKGDLSDRTAVLSLIEGSNVQFAFSYFGIEVLPGSVCSTCPDSPLIYEQFCVANCPFGYVFSVNGDGSFFCQKCEIENLLIPGQNSNRCVCADSHFLVSPTQTCESCPYDCLTCNGRNCITCDTRPPTSFRILNMITQRCECPPTGFMGLGLYDDVVNQNRMCVKCDHRCLTCNGPEVNQCTSCTANRVLTSGICKCLDNFVEVNGKCVCQSPYLLASNGKCNFFGTKCNQNQSLVSISTTEKYCTCAAGYVRSIVSNRCIRQCQSYEQLNYQTETCQCRQGFVRNVTSSVCSSCESKINQIFNPLTQKCECLQGFELNFNGECGNCPSKMYFNFNRNKCECIYNFYQTSTNGPCIKCTSTIDNPNCRNLDGSTLGTLGGL